MIDETPVHLRDAALLVGGPGGGEMILLSLLAFFRVSRP